MYGKYISFLPLSEEIRGLTLTGFRYPLKNHDLSLWKNAGLCVSNEILGERAQLTLESGVLYCMESHD